ncbi:MAG: endonuclease [Firmicutes bacterium]|nr:endonuclease [Bacillota bacterium]
MKLVKKILKVLMWVAIAVVAVAIIGVGILTITEYKPANVEEVIKYHPTEAVFSTGDELTLVTWNCGYGALGDNADFFMDGGTSVYTADRDRVQQNLNGIAATLREENADLILLQEVDINSDRSYHTDERTVLKQAMPGGTDAFAYNFNALYVPYPLPPIGHVESGLYTLSRADIRQADRMALPTPFSWPIRTVNLKRCLLITRIPLADSANELVLINLHLEAYDSGEGKEAQTKALLSLLQSEYDKGNYVIAGGDFNQQFSNVSSPYRVDGAPWQPGNIDEEDFLPDFSVWMNTDAATCRSLDKAYAGANRDDFFCYMIDGFIVSANVKVNEIRTLDTQFVYSDHNPVRMTVTLMPDEEEYAGRR